MNLVETFKASSPSAKIIIIAIGPATVTVIACEADIMTQENQYLANLEAATSYQITGSQLQLSGGQTLNYTEQ